MEIDECYVDYQVCENKTGKLKHRNESSDNCWSWVDDHLLPITCK